MYTGSELLFYGGIGLMGVSAVAGVIALIVLRMSGKRLSAQLEKEYGKKRR